MTHFVSSDCSYLKASHSLIEYKQVAHPRRVMLDVIKYSSMHNAARQIGGNLHWNETTGFLMQVRCKFPPVLSEPACKCDAAGWRSPYEFQLGIRPPD